MAVILKFEEKMAIFIDVKCQLMHIAHALRIKSGRLVFFNNLLSLAGLGIAPLMILSAVLFENQTFLTVAILASGVLALSNWIWTIAVYIFKINKHIEFCQNYPVRIETWLNQNENGLGASLTDDELAALSKSANDFLLQIKGRIEEEHLQVPDWINVKAQQRVLSELGGSCASCRQTWNARAYSEKREIRRIFARRNQGKYCIQCGQLLTEEVSK